MFSQITKFINIVPSVRQAMSEKLLCILQVLQNYFVCISIAMKEGSTFCDQLLMVNLN